MEEFKSISKLFDETIYEVLRPENVVNARNVYGGTAAPQVEAAIARAEQAIQETAAWIESKQEK